MQVAHSNGYDMSNGYHTKDSYAAEEPSYAPASNGNAYPPATDAAYELSADEYRRKHDLTVQGDSCPDPIQTFEGAGFTADIMDEVLSGQRFTGLYTLSRYSLILEPQTPIIQQEA